MNADAIELAQRSRRVHDLAGELGFALTGIAAAEPSAHEAFVRQWIRRGEHGEMHYLATNLDVRLNPGKLLPGAASIICVADFYPPAVAGPGPVPGSPPGDKPRGQVARYAWGDDYHKTIKKRLHRLADGLAERYPEATFKTTVDTAPAMEREHAARAGLGWVGKHTLLLHPTLGSWMLLGLIVTTLRLQGSAEAGYPAPLAEPLDHCGTCTRCIDACPTGCIENPDTTGRRAVDASRCISYLTLEHRSLIDPSLHEAMGDWVAGCDICQQVCPYNQPIEVRGAEEAGAGEDAGLWLGNVRQGVEVRIEPRYEPRELAHGLDLLEVLDWTAADRSRVFQGSALKRMKLEMVRRNAVIAAGNYLASHTDERLHRRLIELANDEAEDALVRETAQQVVARIEGRI